MPSFGFFPLLQGQGEMWKHQTLVQPQEIKPHSLSGTKERSLAKDTVPNVTLPADVML